MENELKFLVDECLGVVISNWLKENGYDTISIAQDFPSIKDSQVLSKAIDEGRILITSDKGFGELVNKNKITHCGIILLRLENKSFNTQIEVIQNLIKEYYNSLSCNFIVASENNVRIAKQQIH